MTDCILTSALQRWSRSYEVMSMKAKFVWNHKVYEARCSSNVNQCKSSDLNGVVLTCAGWRFVSFLMSFLICCFPLLDELVTKVYWPYHATSNFCPFSSFFRLPGSVLLPEMLCQTYIMFQKENQCLTGQCSVDLCSDPVSRFYWYWKSIIQHSGAPLSLSVAVPITCYEQVMTICRAAFTGPL